MPLISFVIPFFNRFDLVKNAVESVILSDYKDIELILIDDASDEEGLGDLIFYFNTYKNITYTRQDIQKGPGNARNYGISISRGEWIFFMDSDDLIAPKALSKFCNFIQSHTESDFIALTNLILRWPDGVEEYKNNHNESKKSIENNFFSKIAGYGSLWNYCFRRKFIIDHQIKCPDAYMDEDTCFLLSAYCNTDNISFYNDEFYIHYENTKLSLSTLSRDFDFESKKILKARIEFFSHILKLSQDKIAEDKRLFVDNLLAKHILCAFWGDEHRKDFMANDKVKRIVDALYRTIYGQTSPNTKGVYIAPCFIDALSALKILSEWDIRVLGFIDNNPDSQRALACKKTFGLNISSVENIQLNNNVILIFGRHSGTIAKQYNDMGLVEGRDYIMTGLL
ncbi:MAG: glycosyltransferase family 2 protein [Bacteroidales bacterium]|jgi:glycosyltransferase involved in cell wall biosynthesis|nr:glycosyltransferase family 2 protein [Bacteroidales bacterium]